MFRAGTLPSATPGVSPTKLVQDGDKLEQTDISACHRRHNQLAMPFLVFWSFCAITRVTGVRQISLSPPLHRLAWTGFHGPLAPALGSQVSPRAAVLLCFPRDLANSLLLSFHITMSLGEGELWF